MCVPMTAGHLRHVRLLACLALVRPIIGYNMLANAGARTHETDGQSVEGLRDLGEVVSSLLRGGFGTFSAWALAAVTVECVVKD